VVVVVVVEEEPYVKLRCS